MGARVQLLHGALIDQIAAGEVVERPSSVVKELIENAIDAGAGTVRVEIEDGGRALVRVADDGHGMAPDDAALAVERHATSKIRAMDDLVRIRTLGFRGEALPSIASVSRFALTTRPRDAIAGTAVRIEGGGTKVVESAGVAPGTVVEVRDLFFNVPARQKFLKSKQAEARQIVDVCLRAALARPELRLVLAHDGRTLRSFLPSLGLAGRAASVFEDEPLRAIEGTRGSLGVEALLGAADRAQRGPRRLYLFVNGRPVVDVKLARQIAFAYGAGLAPGLYPSGVVHLRLPPEEVDVNAHPQKAEVRFADERGVFDVLTRLLAQELDARPYARGSDATRFWEERLHRPRAADGRGPSSGPLFDAPRRATDVADPWGIGGALRDASGGTEAASPTPGPGPSPTPGPGPSPTPGPTPGPSPTPSPTPGPTPGPGPSGRRRSGGFFARLRLVGEARGAFLVCEGERALYLVDARAADHERLVADARRALRAGGMPSRRLLFPARIELSPELVDRACSARVPLLAFGFDVEALGPRTLAAHRVPIALREADPGAALRALLPRVHTTSDDPAIADVLSELLGPAAFRPGQPIPPEWARALLDALDDARGGGDAFPSGPPIVRTLPLPEPPAVAGERAEAIAEEDP